MAKKALPSKKKSPPKQEPQKEDPFLEPQVAGTTINLGLKPITDDSSLEQQVGGTARAKKRKNLSEKNKI